MTKAEAMSHARQYLIETATIAGLIDSERIETMVRELIMLRERGGRLFVIGLGGSAANASHAVNDFRKLCGIEAHAPMDNIAELTARANDEGWPFIFSDTFWTSKDALFVLSVGGGTYSVSPGISAAVVNAKKKGMHVLGIVGRDGGYTLEYGDCVVLVPAIYKDRVTPHSEGFQSVILHCLVSHPDLQRNPTKW